MESGGCVDRPVKKRHVEISTCLSVRVGSPCVATAAGNSKMGEGCHLSPHPARPLPQSSSPAAGVAPSHRCARPRWYPRSCYCGQPPTTSRYFTSTTPPRPTGACLAAPTTDTATSNLIIGSQDSLSGQLLILCHLTAMAENFLVKTPEFYVGVP
ncbi:hypothetical protein GUJ93_ZPchr0013g35180 [Zizania palustris]|uniref:Uncharacterized protein n=1 Tax=Zizania palustris TaxID=103762 RepID=A0A8J5X4Q9_ZIZPA|nr:hypothetical protein GUJ93_ZPchr0013g35180 [Zizania palustris]